MDTKPDKKCVDAIYKKSEPYYSGQWISTARKYQKAGHFLEATRAYEKARNGFGQKSQEWKCLEAWRAYMEEKALKSGPKLVLVMMKDAFYQQLKLPRLLLPVPVADAESILQQHQWTVAGLLENLRYYLLANKNETRKYAPFAVRLAYEVAVYEGLYDDIDKADHYFNLAEDYGPRSLIVTANVAYGYLRIRDYDNAVKEYEQARKILVKDDAFIPDIWLRVANLHFYLGNKVKGKNVVKDYFVKAEALPAEISRKVIQYGAKWATKNKAEKELIGMFREYDGAL